MSLHVAHRPEAPAQSFDDLFHRPVMEVHHRTGDRRGRVQFMGLLLLASCLTVRPTLQVQRAPETPSATQAGADEQLNAVLWMQTAAEYQANALQAFQVGQRMLDRALATPTWTAAEEQTGEFTALPPAVIVDIDETVLDNSPFEAREIRAGQAYSEETWREWVEQAHAEPIPGALTFTKDDKLNVAR